MKNNINKYIELTQKLNNSKTKNNTKLKNKLLQLEIIMTDEEIMITKNILNSIPKGAIIKFF